MVEGPGDGGWPLHPRAALAGPPPHELALAEDDATTLAMTIDRTYLR
jgi:hypothetical protein